ncbi:MAG: hypothetical protein H0T77_16495 [Pyrinomonadaceae bacterium]|nr:hypothetical protein [Pyrinomonadaceae bacterium]
MKINAGTEFLIRCRSLRWLVESNLLIDLIQMRTRAAIVSHLPGRL